MEILNETFINSKIFELFSLVLKRHYETKDKFKPIISYKEFKVLVICFVTSAMRSLLNDTKFYLDECDCVIEKMDVWGEYRTDTQTIAINEDAIKLLYNGNICEMVTIFHELGHFKVNYEILSGIVNVDLIRIIKETAINSFFNHDRLKFELDIKFKPDDYYFTNYHLESEEKIVQMNAIKLFFDFLELADIHISIDEKVYLKKELKKNQRQYQNYLRDFRNEITLNSYWLDFEKAFDFVIQRNKLWILAPQLSIEYYLDDNGNVKKRTKEELIELLKKELDPNKRQCIKDLLDIENKKILSKADFIDYNKIEKKLGLKFLKVSNNNDNY